jgi:hypothetical protein
MNRFGRIGVILLFIGLLVALRILNNQSTTGLPAPAASNSAGAKAGADSILSRYGLHLEEVSRSSGIDFVHQGPKLDAKLDHIMPQIASMGASVSVADFDRDGRPDLYTTNSGEGSANRLYRNLGDGTFRDVAEEMGVADLNRPGEGV